VVGGEPAADLTTKEETMSEHRLEFPSRDALEEWVLHHSNREEIDALVQKLQARRDELEKRAQEVARPKRLSESIRDQGEVLRQLSAVVVKLASTQDAMGKVLEELKEQKKNP
jgi:hypothetical protein